MAIYEIAYHLRIPIYELANKMTYEEFQGWLIYFEKRPIEWRADLRAYTLLQAQGVKEKPWKIFNSLKAIFNKNNSVMDSLSGSKVLHLLSLAKGGDKITLWDEDDLE